MLRIKTLACSLALLLLFQNSMLPQVGESKAHFKTLNDVVGSGQKAAKLGSNVNTDEHEMGPLVTPDGKTLYFSRFPTSKYLGLSDDEEIWYSLYDDKTKDWSFAENIGPPLNNEYPNYVNTISPDGKKLYLGGAYLKTGKEKNGLSESRWVNGSWTKPENILVESWISSAQWAGCYLSSSGKYILLALSGEKKCEGAYDLYFCKKNDAGKWSSPVNLGPMINTKGIESAPFLSDDEMTLFFASDGNGGAGGTDLFMSVRLDESWANWSKPENLGAPVNSDKNESFISNSPGNNKVYFSSDRDGNSDIYTLESFEKTIPVPTPTVAVSTTQEKVETKTRVASIPVIHFNSNSSEIREVDFEILDKVAEELKKDINLKVELHGYADIKGAAEYNLLLSKNRAYLATTYLIRKGISLNRLKRSGHGSSDPVGDNNTEEGKAQNRRVEFKFIR